MAGVIINRTAAAALLVSLFFSAGIAAGREGDKLRRNAPTERKSQKYYKVQKGDTIYSIAKKFNLTQDYLLSVNNMDSPAGLHTGMTIKLIRAEKKTVKKIAKPAGTQAISQQKTKPKFCWPLKKVLNFKRDGAEGVRPIGIIITGKAEAPIVSSESGTVERIGTMRGFGRYVIVKHPGGYATVYSHCGEIAVNEGECVDRGMIIGRTSTAGEIHFQIDYAGRPKNPLKYLPQKS